MVKPESMSAEIYCEKYASEMAQVRSNFANLLAEYDNNEIEIPMKTNCLIMLKFVLEEDVDIILSG